MGPGGGHGGGGAGGWKYLAYGAVSGATARTIVAPLERFKILLEVQGMERLRNPNAAAKYTLRNGFHIILKEEGWRGFYRGNLGNVLHVAPAAAARFYSFETYKKFLLKTERKRHPPASPKTGTDSSAEVRYPPLPVHKRMLCGAMAGITSTTVSFPLDLVRTRLTVETPQTPKRYQGIGHAFVSIVREEGVFALWKGLSVSLLGIAPYVAINFTTYETIRQWVLQRNDNSLPLYWGPLGGALSGTFAMTCTYPFDLLRRRMMLQGQHGEARLYTSTLDAVKKILKIEGPAGFFKGMIPTYLKVVPSVSVSFGTFELCKRLFGE